ncbi:ribonucleoside-diphosphate reductase subunit alpha [Luminiphilus sp. nBUS_07]|uniref:ribonucleoside-diphosphate reductase subunit alpha n=1 Tax=Luminiphilus sp. nBUS_07 TaxID=3395314 RepID=UPI003EB7F915
MQTGTETGTSTLAGGTAPVTGSENTQSGRLQATAPGQLRVIKRNGTVTSFEDSKISVAITKAFLAVEGGTAAASSRIHETVAKLTENVITTFKRRMPSGGTIHIEDIQDQVELALMRAGEHKIARDYVIYREERARDRAAKAALSPESQAAASGINVVMPNGSREPLDIERVRTIVSEACADLVDVSESAIIDEALRNLYDGVTAEEVSTSLVITARTMIEQDPNYSYVAARLLLDNLRAESLDYLGVAKSATQKDMQALYSEALNAFISQGVTLELLSPELLEFDIAALGQALLPERDLQFSYLGLQTLYDRYFIHADEVRIELPQVFFMRVAMGLSIREDDPNARAIEFYQLLSSFDYMSSTPTLFNSGTLRSQLSSCYLTTVPDDLFGIYGAIQDNAMLSKFAGGLGNDWTPVRALGSYIKGTNGKSQGIVPFLKVVNDTAVAVNQGGKRKGAVCAYLETWHLDIEEFLELRKNTGDDRRRTHDMNTANWIPDLFMKRVFEDGDWTLFSPNDVPDLHDLYGKAFEERYAQYEAMAATGEIRVHKTLKAQAVWRKMLGMIFETGHPWMTFKDPCNVRSPQQHVGVVHSSNLCTEITLNTSADEIAVCNLGSVNLPQHIEDGKLNLKKLRATVRTAIRMLDNVIDINYYSVPQAEQSNMRHRPIGLGVMGFQDALYKIDVSYASEGAVSFADQSMEAVSYFAIEASSELAAERGAYSSYEGSLWSQGIFPLDSLDMLVEQRGAEYIEVNRDMTFDWPELKGRVAQHGMRNSNCMAIAPTATIANITGVSQSIEPTYQNLYVKSNLSGEFTVVNPYLVRDLKERDLWDKVMVNDLKYFDGSVQSIDRIPDDLKAKYSTAFEVEPRWLVDSASRRQKWIDQAQSLNLYINNASGKKLDVTYRMAWYSGLKTTYYLRSLAATGTEKSTVESGKLNAVASGAAEAAPQPAPVPQACSLDDPDCEACQ